MLCLFCTIVACGKKTDGNMQEQQTTESAMTWQDQYDLGVRLLNEGNYEEAILAFRAAIQIDPKKADAYVILADAYMQAGNADGAMAALQDGLDHADNVNWVKDVASGLGFYIDENGRVYTMTEDESIAASEAAVQESLAALPVDEQVRYYTSQAGRDWQWCFEDNILVFGQDARTITLEQLKTEALQRGWDSPYDLEVTRYDGVPFTYLTNGFGQALMYGQLQDGAEGGVGFTMLQVGYDAIWYSTRDDYRYQMEPGTDTGILNLQMGDSLETVLTKLGVPNAQQIAASALQWSGTEETRVTYDGGSISKFAPGASDAADGTKVHETISLRYTNVGTEMNGHIQDSIQLEYRVYFKNAEVDTTLTLFFYGPEYELWFYEITNY